LRAIANSQGRTASGACPSASPRGAPPERLLERILAVLAVADHVAAEGQQRRVITVVKRLEGSDVARADAGRKTLVVEAAEPEDPRSSFQHPEDAAGPPIFRSRTAGILGCVRTFAVAGVGVDRPGIIAAVAERLVAHGVNVTDSEMAILRGHFTMMLLVTGPDALDAETLDEELRATGEELGLEVLTLREVADAHGAAAAPTWVVSVHGADHPGILAAVTRALADANVNVHDLHTRVVGEDGGRPLYVMFMEVSTPPELAEDELRARLRAAAESQRVDVALQPLEPDVL
jgi:glycine cleavage system transcriptional repressor